MLARPEHQARVKVSADVRDVRADPEEIAAEAGATPTLVSARMDDDQTLSAIRSSVSWHVKQTRRTQPQHPLQCPRLLLPVCPNAPTCAGPGTGGAAADSEDRSAAAGLGCTALITDGAEIRGSTTLETWRTTIRKDVLVLIKQSCSKTTTKELFLF